MKLRGKSVSLNTIVVSCLIIIFLGRLLVIPLFKQDREDFADGLYYNGYAISEILQDQNWCNEHPNEIDDKRPPVYPLFLSVIYLIFGIENFDAVFIFQIIIGVFVCYYIFLFSLRLFNNQILSLLSLIWSGLYIPYIRYSASLARETLVFFFFIAILYHGYIWMLQQKKKDALLTILFYLFLIHTDSRYLFYLPVFAIPLFYQFSFYPAIKKYMIFVVSVFVLMLPWGI